MKNTTNPLTLELFTHFFLHLHIFFFKFSHFYSPHFQTFSITTSEVLNHPGPSQSVIIRSLMLASLVVINGGQVPSSSRHYPVQIHPEFRPVETGTSCFFSAWLARTGIRPAPESFRLIKQRCLQVREKCLRSSIQDDGARSDTGTKHWRSPVSSKPWPFTKFC